MPQRQVFLYAMWFEYVVQTYILLNTSKFKVVRVKNGQPYSIIS